MTLADIDGILAIERIAYPRPWTRAGYEHELRHNDLSAYHVLEEDGRIVGYAGHWLMAGEMHISMIAVHPDRQRGGLGGLLLTHQLMLACAAEALLVTLEVREGNGAARRLYERAGFIEVGRRKNYYKDSGEAAVLMTLEPLVCDEINVRWQQMSMGVEVM